MFSILSTKKLAENQRQLLLHANCTFVEYDAIKIETVEFENPGFVENAIITSQNTVLSIQNSFPTFQEKIQNCFCVGVKTKSLLEQSGFKVLECAEYADELAELLIKKYSERKFHFYCGNIRSDVIPWKLKENYIDFKEIEVYRTSLNPKKFERDFDAVLFFSPSGVRSYFEANKTSKSIRPIRFETVSVCIGKTTASEAKKYTDNFVIANNTTVESVIAKVVKNLKK